MTNPEPAIIIKSREQLLYTLTEAAEIEHNLMCCYLYAAWSLKTEDDDGLDQDLLKELRRWQKIILHVAVDEMAHLALVANLMHALGGVAHFNRPNFPIASGYHPADMQVNLAPFDRETLQHFIHLERPEGSDEPDGAGFGRTIAYERGLNGLKLTPTAQDYETVGHLYRSVEAGIRHLAETLGEKALFCGDRALQVDASIVRLTGLIAVTDLASAIQAIETIVEQGEGASAAHADGHYQRFISIRDAYDALLAKAPDFSPAHPVARNPVMRRPPVPEGRVWVSAAPAQGVLDLANAVYNHMLRLLAHGFHGIAHEDKRRLIDAAIDLMFAVDPLARELARLKANETDGCNAGISFAALRTVTTPPTLPPTLPTLVQRLDELIAGAQALDQTPRVAKAVAVLKAVQAKVAGTPVKPIAEAVAVTAVPPMPTPAPAVSSPAAGPEVVEGHDMTLVVEMKRCIHARFCVTGAPKSFLANVVGPWLFPDETPAEKLIEIAHACPSGAIGYRMKDAAENEAAPEVNMLRIRENGPYAVNAPLVVNGHEDGFRATLCRCGASKNKPYCDGSHHEVHFAASGEPDTVSLDPLVLRNGPLQVQPQKDGPLRVSGNLEICAGTGRVVQRVTETYLCRCGQSQHKPFCDGSHRAAGFAADGA